MATKKKSVKPAPATPAPLPASASVKPSEAAETTTLSTRFTKEQRDLIDRAAKALNYAPAKFIREASIRRAVDVVNADGVAAQALRRLAFTFVDHLLNPSYEYMEPGESPDDEPTKRIVTRNNVIYKDTDPYSPGFCNGPDVTPLRPNDSELEQIHEALESSGTEFVRMMLEAWTTVYQGGSRYSARVSAESLLKGEQPKDEELPSETN